MEANRIIEIWPGIFLFDLLRYLIPAGIAFLIFWVIGRNHWKHLFIQKTFPKSSQLWTEFKYSMSTVFIFSTIGLGIFLAGQAGLTQIYQNIDQYGWVYFFFSFIIMVVFHDFYFYWTHRWMHHKTIFKHVHKVHHLSTNPSPWAAYSFHPIEAIIQALVFPILIFAIPVHVLIIFLFTIYMILRNVLGHLGFELFSKDFIRNRLFNWNTSTTHHNMHHKHFDCNYGLYFSWWDNLMKTTHYKYQETFEEVKSRPKVCEIKSRTPKSNTITTLIILILSYSTVNAQSISGKWMTYNEQTGTPLSIIEITQSDKSIEGKVSKIFIEPFQGEDPICSRCKGVRKDKKVIGMNFLWGFKGDEDTMSAGKILDPESGEVYTAKMWLEDKSTLKVRGYAGVFDLFYRTQTWKRIGISSEITPVGIWQTIDDHSGKVKSIVEIMSVNGELKGYIKKIYLLPHEGTNPVCIKCEGDLKNSKIVGMRILWGFKIKENIWEDGKILDPGNGNTYSASLWLINHDTLKIRGYLGPFYRSQIWKKIGSLF